MLDLPPPSDLDLESCHLLNCLESRQIGTQKLHEDYFFFEPSKWVSRAIKSGNSAGELVSIINLENHMAEVGAPEAQIERAVNNLLEARAHERYGHSVERELGRLYQRRALFSVFSDVSYELRDNSSDVDLLTQKASAAIESYQQANKAKTVFNAKHLCGEAAEVMMNPEEKEQGFTTGLIKLDKDSGGYRRKEVAVIAAQSHWGKTSYLCMCALANARKGAKVLVCTGEDTSEMIGRSLLVQNSSLSRYEMEVQGSRNSAGIVEAASGIPENLLIFETFGLTPAQIGSKVSGLIQEHDIDIAFFDYLKVMSSRSSYEDERHQLNDIYEQIAFVVKRTGIAGIVFSQITDADNPRDLKMLIRGSKDVAHRAEMVLIGLKNRDNERQLVLSKRKGGYVQAGNNAVYTPTSDTRRMVFCEEEERYDFGEMQWD